MLGLARETSRPFAIDTSFEVYENTRLVLVRVIVVTACCIISIFLIFFCVSDLSLKVKP